MMREKRPTATSTSTTTATTATTGTTTTTTAAAMLAIGCGCASSSSGGSRDGRESPCTVAPVEASGSIDDGLQDVVGQTVAPSLLVTQQNTHKHTQTNKPNTAE